MLKKKSCLLGSRLSNGIIGLVNYYPLPTQARNWIGIIAIIMSFGLAENCLTGEHFIVALVYAGHTALSRK
jgi:hypothetical protein